MAPNRKRFITVLIAAMLFAAAGGLATFWWQSRPGGGIQVPQLSDAVVPGLRMAIGRMQQSASRQGILQWDLEAANARYLEESNQMVLEKPEVLFYTKDKRSVRLTAARGLLNTRTNDIEASGGVTVQSAPYTMTTERMLYRHDTRIISSQAPVTVRSGTEQIKADKMEIDLNTQRVHMQGNVAGRFSGNVLVDPE
jgi:LPS export ABC transporter protein LptC